MNAWLAKPIPLGLVYGGPGGAFRQRLPLKKCLSASRGWFSCSFWTADDPGTRHWVATSIPACKVFFCDAQSNQAAGKAFPAMRAAVPRKHNASPAGYCEPTDHPIRVELESEA